MDQTLVDDLAAFAGRLADASGPLIRDAHRDGFAAEAKGDGSPVWVIDPIDGTPPFLAGIPVFGTLIALIEDGWNRTNRP